MQYGIPLFLRVLAKFKNPSRHHWLGKVASPSCDGVCCQGGGRSLGRCRSFSVPSYLLYPVFFHIDKVVDNMSDYEEDDHDEDGEFKALSAYHHFQKQNGTRVKEELIHEGH